jgi:hypothetical protein
MSQQNDALAIARKVRADQRARGIAPTPKKDVFEKLAANPKSKSLALRAYFLDMAGVPQNKGCTDAPISEMRAEARDSYRAARAEGLAASLRRICFDCVGGNDDDGPRQSVRDCQISDCQLHAVRPWQKVIGRKGIGLGVKKPVKQADPSSIKGGLNGVI